MEVHIREASPTDAGSIARVHVDAWRTTYAGIVPAEFLASLSYADRESAWGEVLTTGEPSTSHVVAETEGGDVVGFAAGGPVRETTRTYHGELYSIYVLDEHQRRGVGRRLLSAVANRLLVDGVNSILVWVLKDNQPACQFYEALGGTHVGQKGVTIGGLDLLEVCYGWRDISDLAAGDPSLTNQNP